MTEKGSLSGVFVRGNSKQAIIWETGTRMVDPCEGQLNVSGDRSIFKNK